MVLLTGFSLLFSFEASVGPPRYYRRGLKDEIQQERRELRDSREQVDKDRRELNECDWRYADRDREDCGWRESAPLAQLAIN